MKTLIIAFGLSAAACVTGSDDATTGTSDNSGEIVLSLYTSLDGGSLTRTETDAAYAFELNDGAGAILKGEFEETEDGALFLYNGNGCSLRFVENPDEFVVTQEGDCGGDFADTYLFELRRRYSPEDKE